MMLSGNILHDTQTRVVKGAHLDRHVSGKLLTRSGDGHPSICIT